METQKYERTLKYLMFLEFIIYVTSKINLKNLICFIILEC